MTTPHYTDVGAVSESDLAERIAKWASEVAVKTSPASAVRRLKLLVLDSIACALAARTHPATLSARAASAAFGGSGDARTLGSTSRVPLLAAVLINGAQIRALDWNDIYWGKRQGGHPSDVLAAAFAVGETCNSSGRDFLSAALIGYEIYCRLADQIAPDGFVDHTTQGVVSSAAACARLMELDIQTTAHAIRIAATTGVHAAVWRKGKIASGKAIIAALAAQSGVMAAFLARSGVEGPPSAIESAFGLAGFMAASADCQELVPRPGERLRVESVAVKLYPCVGAAQAAISAGVRLHRDLGERKRDISSIRIRMRDIPVVRNLMKDEYRRPSNSETADHSMYFLIAASLLDGSIGGETFARSRWIDPDVTHLMDRTTITADLSEEESQAAFPAAIEIVLKDGSSLAAMQSRSFGDPGSDGLQSHVVEKARRATAHLGARQQERIVQMVEELESCNDIGDIIGTTG